MQTAVLGIDTSAYTCSMAIMTDKGCLLSDTRRVLDVEQGKRGLRQSEALYQHIRHLPAVCEQAFATDRRIKLGAVAFTDAPRRQEGSFMPVFLAGQAIARAIAAAQGVPCGTISHQEAHIWAAMWGLPQLTTPPSRFLAVHLSGGTTEAVLVDGVGEEHLSRPRVEIVGATGDISAGQFVDRVGTALGLPFPCGPALEELAWAGEAGQVRLPSAVRERRISFSGPETAAQQAIHAGASAADVALGVLCCLGESLQLWIRNVAKSAGSVDVVLAGGVMANRFLRESLNMSDALSAFHLWFAPPELSCDNAVGVAAWAACLLSSRPISALPDRGQRT